LLSAANPAHGLLSAAFPCPAAHRAAAAASEESLAAHMGLLGQCVLHPLIIASMRMLARVQLVVCCGRVAHP
jgi:citrate lyase beta subunit